MIARRFLLLVGRIVLFVDDDECEIVDRREHRRARAHDHARFAALDAMPLLGAFAIGERGMQDGHFVAEDLVQVGGDGWREADLRNEQNGGASGIEYRAHRREIDRGFARSVTPCSSMPENLRASTASRMRASAACCAAVKSKSKCEEARLGAGDGELRGLFDDFDQAAADQRGKRGARDL